MNIRRKIKFMFDISDDYAYKINLLMSKSSSIETWKVRKRIVLEHKKQMEEDAKDARKHINQILLK